MEKLNLENLNLVEFDACEALAIDGGHPIVRALQWGAMIMGLAAEYHDYACQRCRYGDIKSRSLGAYQGRGGTPA